MSAQSFKEKIENGILDLIWSLWTELGVQGIQRKHSSMAIDPEALIAFTGALGNLDPRLRDEATDWCIENYKYISGSRLKTIINEDYADFSDTGRLIATVNEYSQARLPGATTPHQFKSRKRGQTITIKRPSLILFRLRCLVGTGARSGIIFHLLSTPGAEYSAADLADRTKFTKRRVADTLHDLNESGLVFCRRQRNQLLYSLDLVQQMQDLAGDLPSLWPLWTDIFPWLLAIWTISRNCESNVSSLTAYTAIRKLTENHPLALSETLLSPPPLDKKGIDFWPAFLEWATGCKLLST
jgi:hypothetical protein